MTILILGAGLMQKPAITAAKKLGWYVAVVDGNPHALCAPLGDHFESIDLKDLKGLENFARSLQEGRGLDGVFTAGTDFSTSVAYIAETLHLSGHSYEAALNATNKVRMRSCFAKEHVPSPHFIQIDENLFNELQQKGAYDLQSNMLFAPFHFPLVVKPTDNMGGRGCSRVDDYAQLLSALNDAIPYSRTKCAIVEEFMDGKEFSLDALVYDGEVHIMGFADRHIFYPPYFIEMGHTMPTDICAEDMHKVIDVFTRGVRALGLTHGVAKGDMKLTSKGAMIGEIAARLSGGYMSGWTFPYSSGVNLSEQALLLAVGKKPSVITAQKTCTSAERAWLSIPGKVASVIGLDDARRIPFVQDVFQRSKEGDEVRFAQNNVEKCGNVISCAATRSEAVAAAEQARSEIIVRLEGHNKDTELFLAQPLDALYPPSAFMQGDFSTIKAVFHTAAVCSERDWNNRTLAQTIRQFEKITGIQFEKMEKTYIHALQRGGLQGVLYIYDTMNKN